MSRIHTTHFIPTRNCVEVDEHVLNLLFVDVDVRVLCVISQYVNVIGMKEYPLVSTRFAVYTMMVVTVLIGVPMWYQLMTVPRSSEYPWADIGMKHDG